MITCPRCGGLGFTLEESENGTTVHVACPLCNHVSPEHRKRKVKTAEDLLRMVHLSMHNEGITPFEQIRLIEEIDYYFSIPRPAVTDADAWMNNQGWVISAQGKKDMGALSGPEGENYHIALKRVE